ncbi:hypothetical protein FGO68_gene3623 [Halteria grandinella]|uniref:Uncharacterized protein n=1 Tax=Halteria grandinella TaxID=5974 RepID=A0A8J8T340_HALGN|nr:hypothetical protein FGO68_gene3623 [Halteria grandinella]
MHFPASEDSLLKETGPHFDFLLKLACIQVYHQLLAHLNPAISQLSESRKWKKVMIQTQRGLVLSARQFSRLIQIWGCSPHAWSWRAFCYSIFLSFALQACLKQDCGCQSGRVQRPFHSV